MGLPGPWWPMNGASAAQSLVLVLASAVLLGIVPLGWWLIRRRWGRESAGPLWPLLAFLIIALGYALWTPPWQMPDEPQHMVHVELVRRAGLSAGDQIVSGHASPKVRAIADSVQGSVLRSLRETHLVRWAPALKGQLDHSVIPGPPELSPSLYYSAAGLITRPFGSEPILWRLGLLRVFGVVLAAWTVWACGAAGRLLWPGRRFREAPMVAAAALPTFAAFSGSVNNDALANLLGGLLIVVLLAGVVRRTPLSRPLPWALVVAALVVLGLVTKRSFAPLLVLVPVAVGIRLRHRVRLLLAGAILVELVAGVALATGSHQRLALWGTGTLSQSYRCPDGRGDGWAICLSPAGNTVGQLLLSQRTAALRGADLRLALWARSQPNGRLTVDVSTDAGPIAYRRVVPGDHWERVELSGRVPPASTSLRVTLTSDGDGRVEVDDVVLHRDGNAPVGDGYAAGAGRLDGVGPARNELVNGSGEVAQLSVPSMLPPSIQRSLGSIVDSASAVVHTSDLGDVTRAISHRATVTFGMFWGTTGWPTPPPMFPVAVQWLLGALAAGALLGALVGLIRLSTPGAVGFMLVGVLLMTLAVIARNFPYDDSPVTSGRYLFPGLVAFVTVLVAGWRHLWPNDDRSFRRVSRCAVPVLHGAFLVFVFVPFLGR